MLIESLCFCESKITNTTVRPNHALTTGSPGAVALTARCRSALLRAAGAGSGASSPGAAVAAALGKAEKEVLTAMEHSRSSESALIRTAAMDAVGELQSSFESLCEATLSKRTWAASK